MDKLSITPVAVWWPGLDTIERWVTQLGVNILWYDRAIHSMPGDWAKLHQKIDDLRKRGFPVWVVRQPAYLLTTDKLTIDFDKQYGDHLYCYTLDDEFEDKVAGGNLWTNPTPILNYVKQRVADYKAFNPAVPIIANFNGSHVSNDLRDRYEAMVSAGIDIVSSDVYPAAAQQVDPTGKLLYPDVVQGYVAATKLFKSWWPHKPVWTFADTCNQNIGKAGDPGWAPPWKFVGSRCLTTQELWQIAYYVQQAKGDGLAWFPQGNWGAVNDATPAELYSTLKGISDTFQPKPPPAKVLAHTITIFSDGSVEVA